MRPVEIPDWELLGRITDLVQPYVEETGALAFEATDSYGASCTGVVHVIVPLVMKPGVSVIDDGKGYDSTRGTR